jgi:hypothetical protein
MLINTYTVWALTVMRFFQPVHGKDTLFETAVIFGLVARVLSALINIYVKHNQCESGLNLKKLVKLIIWDLISFFYFTIVLVVPYTNNICLIVI